MKLSEHTLSFSRRLITIFFAILCIHIAAILVYTIYALRFDTEIPVALSSATPTQEHEVSDSLLEKAVDASTIQDWDAVSLHISRYLAMSLNVNLNFDIDALSECLRQIKLRPTAFISGEYAQQFLDWFVMTPTEYWLAETIDVGKQTFMLEESWKNGKFVCITGRPFLECYTIMRMSDYPSAPIPMIVDAEVLVGNIESNTYCVQKKMEFPSEGQLVQYVWPPGFHDLDGDGHDEIWIRFNREAADGFMQCLTIFRDDPDHLSLVTNFVGYAEGIARRLPNGNVQVGYGCAEAGQEQGHLGYSQFIMETLEYQNGSFIKVSERRIPHILWSDAWMDFYDLP
jgi:hypothetical protein